MVVVEHLIIFIDAACRRLHRLPSLAFGSALLPRRRTPGGFQLRDQSRWYLRGRASSRGGTRGYMAGGAKRC
jgi:hypothetical protein